MLSLFERNNHLFDEDILINKDILEESVKNSSFLVLGELGLLDSQLLNKSLFDLPKNYML